MATNPPPPARRCGATACITSGFKQCFARWFPASVAAAPAAARPATAATPPPEPGTLGDLAKQLITNSAIIAALLYLAGWTYLQGYFDSFEIDVAQLGLSWNEILVYSTVMLRHIVKEYFLTFYGALWFVGFIVFILILRLAKPLILAVANFLGPVISLVVLPSLLVLCGISGIADFSSSLGRERALADRTVSTNAIKLDLQTSCGAADDQLRLLGDGGRLRLLFATEHWFFLRTAATSPLDTIRVVQLPASCVLTLQTFSKPERPRGDTP